jgi:hypothetical protein
MELVLVAIAMLVAITALDAGLAPNTAAHKGRPAGARRAFRRVIPKRSPRRTIARPYTLGGLVARKVMPSGARWWWE